MVWATLDGPTGKRLAPFMGEMVAAMERSGELEVAPEVRSKLLRVSAATIDRLLAPERRLLQVRGRSGTKPGSILKAQIPIRTFAEWDDRRPGFCEVDLVGHEGGDPSGEFCHTLNLTCVNTGWTEPRAIRTKAQRWVREAIEEIREQLPFPMLGLDSDNGSEFINVELYRWCEENAITFTRSRPARKNDNCYVEQKNWPRPPAGGVPPSRNRRKRPWAAQAGRVRRVPTASAPSIPLARTRSSMTGRGSPSGPTSREAMAHSVSPGWTT